MQRLRPLTVGVLAAALAFPARAGAQNEVLWRFQNHFRPATFLHAEQVLAAGEIQPGWWSADWIVEPVPGTSFVKLRNRYRQGAYIHTEHGRPELGPIGDNGNWWSAQWSLEAVPGTPFIRIRNRFRPNEYLHTERGTLEAGPIDQGWWSAQWTRTRRPADPAPLAVGAPVQQPVQMTPANPPTAIAPATGQASGKPSAPAPAAPPALIVRNPVDPTDDRCINGVCADMSDPTRWRILAPHAPIPADAYVAGNEVANGVRRNLYVCVAYFDTFNPEPGGGQPGAKRWIGKTGPGFEGCNVPVNGREIVVTRNFLILLNPLPGPLGDMPGATWVRAMNGVTPFRGIQTFGGEDLCRAPHEGGMHPGRVVPGRGCAIGYGGVEVNKTQYEVLVRAGISN